MRLALRLVLLTIVGLGSLAWVAVSVGRLGGPTGPFTDTYELTTSFSDATGLYPGDELRLAGVPIGKVSDVTVDRGDAIVTFTVADDHRLPQDTRFELHWRSVLGQRYVLAVHDGVAPDAPVLADGARVGSDRTADAADISALLNDVEPLLRGLDVATVNRVATTMADVIQGREQQIGEAIDASSRVLDQVAARADVIGTTIEDLAAFLDGLAARDREAVALLDAVARTSDALAGRADDLGSALGDTGEVAGRLDEILRANRAELDTAVEQFGAVAGTVAGRDEELGEGLRTLAWTSAALIRATNAGDWLQVYGRGFGLINTWYPEPRVGPDYDDVGPDDTEAPAPLLGQPRLPFPDVGPVGVGALTIGGDEDGREASTGLELLFQPLVRERQR